MFENTGYAMNAHAILTVGDILAVNMLQVINKVKNSPGTDEFPAQMASNAEDVSIW